MNNLQLWLTWTTLGPELRALDQYEQLRAMDDMNDFESWAHASTSYG